MVKKKYIDKKDAYTFQLVHRSRQDPEINNPEASDRVFRLVGIHDHRGKTIKNLKEELGEKVENIRNNEGEAANYGIYYDDTNYDYMQHTKPVGDREGVVLSAPKRTERRNNQNGIIRESIIPKEVLPSAIELPKNYQSQQAVQDAIAGFQPDMDPRLREVLGALEDEAYVDDTIESDDFRETFFEEIAKSGEVDEEQFYGEDLDGWESDDPTKGIDTCDLYKKISLQKVRKEMAESISRFPASTYRRKNKSGARTATSGYSMSSSSMFRNDHLTLLDDRFDKIEEEYDRESDEEDNDPNQRCANDDQFNVIMDDFLDHYELRGRKLNPKEKDSTALSELDSIRKSLGKAKIY
ncbi:Protein LTV1 [Neolecta irregularis DAH-3]|uniref:Protein LTV1 n=1 Tax=Neolecta irregularis (strain DAH-3) TaxID=1198029 RepID=A0A1U7LWI7_NEOID|nr:Protein LTV1 [Neolecta irregularis DAH-3]|eukprot:OLL26989.1 Protein LTV1 [Neolecta irregularis DAH-3]